MDKYIPGQLQAGCFYVQILCACKSIASSHSLRFLHQDSSLITKYYKLEMKFICQYTYLLKVLPSVQSIKNADNSINSQDNPYIVGYSSDVKHST